MRQEEIEKVIAKQRAYFEKGHTLSVERRMIVLKRLKKAIKSCEKEILEALKKDLGKSSTEAYMCEIGMTFSEISYVEKHIRAWTKEKRVRTPLAQFPSKSYQKPSPYGVVLIMSPWNYPFLLTMEPLVDAIAAGNTAILKPSAYSPHTSKVIEKIIKMCVPSSYIEVITGGRRENAYLLEQKFDYIFFTGSQSVGKFVMEKASKHLTPVTLELGGKSPCIVDESANIKLAAKRIVFGKYLNCGQTCVAPDYILCEKSVKQKLIAELKKQIQKQYGKDPLENKDYGKIINRKHFDRICRLMDEKKIVYGGFCQEELLKIEPTIMDDVKFSDAVMQEEIFGPVLPILTYDSIEEAIYTINQHPHPLALYVFSSNRRNIRMFTSRCGYGGGCINDTIIHLATTKMPFGGFGESGMGSYHGKAGFDTFTHKKSIVDKKTWLDLPMRYQPYRKIFEKIIRVCLR